VRYEFRWNDWNVDHIGKHGVTTDEAEHVVNYPARGYPEYSGDGKYTARGQAASGRNVQAIYFFDPDGVIYVIHARDLTEREKRRLCRKGRR
jgi:uncharacterized protein